LQGHALVKAHELFGTQALQVHVDVPAAMSGVTRFGETSRGLWSYSKAENVTQPKDLAGFDLLVTARDAAWFDGGGGPSTSEEGQAVGQVADRPASWVEVAAVPGFVRYGLTWRPLPHVASVAVDRLTERLPAAIRGPLSKAPFRVGQDGDLLVPFLELRTVPTIRVLAAAGLQRGLCSEPPSAGLDEGQRRSGEAS
jgi:hypothetical protein